MAGNAGKLRRHLCTLYLNGELRYFKLERKCGMPLLTFQIFWWEESKLWLGRLKKADQNVSISLPFLLSVSVTYLQQIYSKARRTRWDFCRPIFIARYQIVLILSDLNRPTDDAAHATISSADKIPSCAPGLTIIYHLIQQNMVEDSWRMITTENWLNKTGQVAKIGFFT